MMTMINSCYNDHNTNTNDDYKYTEYINYINSRYDYYDINNYYLL
jgi:hypothetical protein